MGSTDTSVAVHCFHVDGHRELRGNDTGPTATLGDLLPTLPALPSSLQRLVPVRAPIYRQAPQWNVGSQPTPSMNVVLKTKAKTKSAASRDTGGWREETLARMRALILEADPKISEERKWKKPSNGMKGVPVWSHDGIVCTGEIYAKVVKLTFARGASIPDPSRLFNSSLEGNTRRAIDIHEGDEIDARAFKALVKAAVARNEPAAVGGAAAAGRVRAKAKKSE